MKIREVHIKNDYEQIKELHSKYNLKILSRDEWSKFWLENPYLSQSKDVYHHGWVIEDNNKIFGYLGNLIKEYYFNEEKIIAACIHAWVVDNKYRWQAFLLIRKFFAQKNIDIFLNTTANAATKKIWLKYDAKKMPLKNFQKAMFITLDLEVLINSFLKIKKIILPKYFTKIAYYLFSIILYKKINSWKKMKKTMNTNLNSNINDKFDKFWFLYKSSSKNKFIQSRTSGWLNWHFKEKMNNGKAWIFTVEKKNEIVGYAICVEQNNEDIDLKRISLVDLVAIGDEPNIYISLLKECAVETKKRGYHVFEVIGFEEKKREIFSNFNILSRKLPNFPFYYKVKNEKYENLLKLNQSWDPSLIDGDSFL